MQQQSFKLQQILKKLPNISDAKTIHEYFTLNIVKLFATGIPKDKQKDFFKKFQKQIVDSCIKFLLKIKKTKITIRILNEIKEELKTLETYFVGKNPDSKRKKEFEKLLDSRIKLLDPYRIFSQQMKKNGGQSNQTIYRMKVMGYQGNTIQAAKKKYDSTFNFYKYIIPAKKENKEYTYNPMLLS